MMYNFAVKSMRGGKAFSTKIHSLAKDLQSTGFKAINSEISAEIFEKAIWKIIDDKNYKLVADIFDGFEPNHRLWTKNSTLAAMTANSILSRPATVKEMFMSSIESQHDRDALYLLVHSYCTADRLNIAEYFLNECLSRHIINNPKDTAAQTLQNQLFSSVENRQSSFRDSKHAHELQGFEDTSFQCLNVEGENRMPLFIWATFVRMYSGRQAWKQCLHILQYVESSQLYTVSEQEPQTNSTDSSSVRLNWDHLHDFDHFTRQNSEQVQRSIVYHHTLRALCLSSQFDRALQLLARMRSMGVKAELSAAIHLLTVFTTNISSNSSSSSFVPSPSNYAQLGDLAVDLKEDVLLTLLSWKKSSADPLSGRQSARDLVTTYITLLSRLNRVQTALQLIRLLSDNYPELMCGETVIPLMARLHELDEWEAALEAFTLLEKHAPLTHKKLSPASALAYQEIVSALRKGKQTELLSELVDGKAVALSRQNWEFANELAKLMKPSARVEKVTVSDKLLLRMRGTTKV